MRQRKYALNHLNLNQHSYKKKCEGGKDVTNSKDILSLGHLGTEADHLLFLLLLAFAGSHCLVDKDRTVILTQLKPNS